jgi:DNA end-binding protein Ku
MGSVRSIGSAVISFGMVSIPTKLYTATSEERVSFNLLHQACGGRIKQQTTCPKCEKTLERSEVVRGYEVGKDQFVMFDESDFLAVEATATPAMEIQEFVPQDEIDEVYFVDSVYLGPDKGSERAYSLLHHALTETGMIALAQRVYKGKEQLVAIRARRTGLVLHILYYANEVRDQTAAIGNLPPAAEREGALAVKLVKKMAAHFHPERYADSYRSRVEAVVAKKQAGEQVVGAPTPKMVSPVDILAALQASVDDSGVYIEPTPTETPTKPKKAPKMKRGEAQP